MSDEATAPDAVDGFIQRWGASGAAERANYALFLAELCDLLEVPRPEPTRPDDAENAYVFERSVTFHNGDGSTSVGRIDLYKRGCFVLEAKQGAERPEPAGELTLTKRTLRRGTAVRGTAGWDNAMLAARGQAEQYVKALPASEPNPPFLIVVDVGHSIELFTDFTRQGRTYTPFPDALSHRVKLRDLADGETRERLRLAWTDPLSLDPSRRTAKVTREIAGQLAKLARLLEKSGHTPETVAHFLMRCLFTFFAEDVGLLPKEGFTSLLRSLRERGETALFPEMVRSLWETMKGGGFSPLLRSRLLRFNGGLFESAEALPVTDEQLDLLIQAGEKQWREVEPAIFGTLLERALDERERHKLGAHYTPRAYVERLVLPTIIEPLRDEWASVQTAAVTLANEGKLPEAREQVRAFLRKLCDTIVLDPACGSGNFLYVTLEHMKRLEGEVLDALRGFGETQAAFEGFGLTVDPHQFLGIEINPRAAAIADLVLWIGYLQWHFRTYGNLMPAEPIIKAFHNIDCKDAILECDGTEAIVDEHGEPVTRWDGQSMKRHTVTAEEVPDETAQVPVYRYRNPRKAEWPSADFVIGNPPYVGVRRLRATVGDEYIKGLLTAYPDVPETCDMVMYWWERAAIAVASGASRRFGLITTNSIVQEYSRRLVDRHIGENGNIRLTFAVADHPWVDASDGAAVRIAMTVACARHEPARSAHIGMVLGDDENASVTFRSVERIGTSLNEISVHESVRPLKANVGMCFQGVVPAGDGFKLDVSELATFGYSSDELPPVIRPYIIGRDIVQILRHKYIIDFFSISAAEAQNKYPRLYQHLLDRVYPERKHNNRAAYRDRWWIFAEPRPAMRRAINGLRRYIVIPYTSKFRPFIFVDHRTLPDAMAYAIASDDAFILGILSSRAHVTWALAAGGRLGVGNDPRYTSNGTFLPFPFPEVSEMLRVRIRRLGESLDAHRKDRQSEHSSLTLTSMYNILEKLRSVVPLTDRERVIHDQGLVSILKQIHDDLDAAVFDAYGWPHDLSDEDILCRLVDLNRERAAEEARGVIRWLRPEFQNPGGTKAATQAALPIETEVEPVPTAIPITPATKQPWPKSLAEQAQAVRSALSASPAALTPEQLAKTFIRGQSKRVAELLETLVSLGQARATGDGRYIRS
jgi:hypothetical protein